MIRAILALAALALATGAARAEDGAFHPARTAWGDPDLTGTWPMQNINDAGIPLERPAEMGERRELTEAEFAERLARAETSDARTGDFIRNSGTQGLADWVRHAAVARQGSLLVDPPDGRLPPLTPAAQALHEAGRSS